MIPVLCRDCIALDSFEAVPERCPACGSPRLVGHAELADLAIAHIDCDAFYATVEKRDRPELAEQPVIVGGGQRGVVLACCYVARLYGVRSAMPMFKALAACPDAVVIRPDMTKYREVGYSIAVEITRHGDIAVHAEVERVVALGYQPHGRHRTARRSGLCFAVPKNCQVTN